MLGGQDKAIASQHAATPVCLVAAPSARAGCVWCVVGVLTPLLLLSLQVMDETAVTLCKENDIKIVIFDAMVPGNIMRAAMGEDVGTLVSHTC